MSKILLGAEIQGPSFFSVSLNLAIQKRRHCKLEMIRYLVKRRDNYLIFFPWVLIICAAKQSKVDCKQTKNPLNLFNMISFEQCNFFRTSTKPALDATCPPIIPQQALRDNSERSTPSLRLSRPRLPRETAGVCLHPLLQSPYSLAQDEIPSQQRVLLLASCTVLVATRNLCCSGFRRCITDSHLRI